MKDGLDGRRDWSKAREGDSIFADAMAKGETRVRREIITVELREIQISVFPKMIFL